MSFGTNTPFGLSSGNSLIAAGSNGKTRVYTVDTTTGNLFTNDPVKIVNGKIQACAAGDTSIGTCLGISYISAGGGVNSAEDKTHWLNGTAVKSGSEVTCYVDTAPYTIFTVQTNASGALIEANVGNTANWAVGAGDKTTGVSNYTLDQATLGTAATLNMTIIGRLQTEANQWGVEYNVVEVLINTHAYKAPTLGS